jgi:methionine synthase II (cobalamin-independent)
LALPPFCPTGVGSLPDQQLPRALARVAQHCPHLPFAPQLPQAGRARGMIAEALHGPAVPEGLTALLHATQNGAFPQAQALKSQLTGPITLSLCAPEATDLTSLAEAVAARAVAQARAIAALGQRPVIVLDEPCLGLPGRLSRGAVVQALRRPILAAQAQGAQVGLHCCAAMDLSLLDDLPLTIYSFDADHGLEATLNHPAIGRLLRRGGILALGLAPTDRAPSADGMEARLRGAILASGFTISGLGPQLWLTASCGLGLCSPPLAERIMEETARLGRRLVS